MLELEWSITRQRLALVARADRQGSLVLRNFYHNRDYRQTGVSKSQAGNGSEAFMFSHSIGFYRRAAGGQFQPPGSPGKSSG